MLMSSSKRVGLDSTSLCAPLGSEASITGWPDPSEMWPIGPWFTTSNASRLVLCPFLEEHPGSTTHLPSDPVSCMTTTEASL